MDNKQLREDVAAILQDFVAVLTEEVAYRISFPKSSLDWEWEIAVMNRISPLIEMLRKGESLDPNDAYKRVG